MRQARKLTRAPKLHPVEATHPVSGLEFRRKNVGQFAIVYAYIEPTEAAPGGVVSVRAVHHGAEQDVFFRVEEARAGTEKVYFAGGLLTGERSRYAPRLARDGRP
jgi:hypothetical protein